MILLGETNHHQIQIRHRICHVTTRFSFKRKQVQASQTSEVVFRFRFRFASDSSEIPRRSIHPGPVSGDISPISGESPVPTFFPRNESRIVRTSVTFSLESCMIGWNSLLFRDGCKIGEYWFGSVSIKYCCRETLDSCVFMNFDPLGIFILFLFGDFFSIIASIWFLWSLFLYLYDWFWSAEIQKRSCSLLISKSHLSLYGSIFPLPWSILVITNWIENWTSHTVW